MAVRRAARNAASRTRTRTLAVLERGGADDQRVDLRVRTPLKLHLYRALRTPD
jgi:hypothetical protein